jgi:RsiW-degrading membrane proteinase PrsW (M82 family)
MNTEWMMIGIAILASLSPGLGWLFFWYKKDYLEPEPKHMVLLAFVRGFLYATPLVAIFYVYPMFEGRMTILEVFRTWPMYVAMPLSVLLLAYFEEWLKAKSALKTGKLVGMEFDQVVDGMVYAIATGLGFAVCENIFYFTAALSYFDVYSWQFAGIVAFRSLGTMLAHAMFSGVFGLFWGHAFCSKGVSPLHSYSTRKFLKSIPQALRFHVFFGHILQSRTSTRKHESAVVVCEGLLLATLLHVVHNLLVTLEVMGKMLTPLIAPMLVGLVAFLAYQFKKPKNVEITRAICGK